MDSDSIPLDEKQLSKSHPESDVVPELVVSKGDQDAFPEGGLWGWLSVLGSFCSILATIGFITSWGVFQAYYESLEIASPASIAWIGSVQYSFIFLPGIITGNLFDVGYCRTCLMVAFVLYIVANFLIAECHHYWQFLLCQGFALGLGCGILYVPCVAVVSQYFNKKRPIVFSLISMGVSIGGIIFPIMFRNLLPSIGFKWTIRAMAFINAAMLGICLFTMFPRLPPSKARRRGWFSVDDFRRLEFTYYTISTFMTFLGLYTMLTYLSVSSLHIGASTSLAFYLVSIANATSTFGRLLGGIVAIKHGPINALAIFTSLAAVCTYIWPYVTSLAGFIVLTCFYGMSSGAFVGLFPAATASLGDISGIGRRAGEQMTLMGIGALIGPPISGAILDDTNSFKPVGLYAGSTVVLAVIFMMASRYAKLHKLFGGKM